MGRNQSSSVIVRLEPDTDVLDLVLHVFLACVRWLPPQPHTKAVGILGHDIVHPRHETTFMRLHHKREQKSGAAQQMERQQRQAPPSGANMAGCSEEFP